mmetsp:Transcript_74256/g.159189  ORF Transcript_74256/g.159189 Transcript_74256/m.159189 type:complete len:242 (+) Transcript_74256:702-1427(+)
MPPPIASLVTMFLVLLGGSLYELLVLHTELAAVLGFLVKVALLGLCLCHLLALLILRLALSGSTAGPLLLVAPSLVAAWGARGTGRRRPRLLHLLLHLHLHLLLLLRGCGLARAKEGCQRGVAHWRRLRRGAAELLSWQTSWRRPRRQAKGRERRHGRQPPLRHRAQWRRHCAQGRRHCAHLAAHLGHLGPAELRKEAGQIGRWRHAARWEPSRRRQCCQAPRQGQPRWQTARQAARQTTR